MTLEKQNTHGDAIAGNRRQNRRYDLHLEVKWKLIRRRRVLETGAGQTLDISSGGIRFDAGTGCRRREARVFAVNTGYGLAEMSQLFRNSHIRRLFARALVPY